RVTDRGTVLFDDPAVIDPLAVVELPPVAELFLIRRLVGLARGLQLRRPADVRQRGRAEGESRTVQRRTREGRLGDGHPASLGSRPMLSEIGRASCRGRVEMTVDPHKVTNAQAK